MIILIISVFFSEVSTLKNEIQVLTRLLVVNSKENGSYGMGFLSGDWIKRVRGMEAAS